MKETCVVNDCGGTPRSSSLCSKHYQKLRRTGELVLNDSETLTIPLPPCSVTACDGKVYAGGMCTGHYLRWYKRAARRRPKNTTTQDRFWSKVIKTEWCWLWTGNTNEYGRGVFVYDGAAKSARRYSYMQHHGVELERNELLRQTCTVPECVNPAHLRRASEVKR